MMHHMSRQIALQKYKGSYIIMKRNTESSDGKYLFNGSDTVGTLSRIQ